MILALLPGTYVRFDSPRTGETLLEAKRLNGALIIYGNASRDHYDVGIDGDVVRIDGTLWDRRGPAVSFRGLLRRRRAALPHEGDRRLRRPAGQLRRRMD